MKYRKVFYTEKNDERDKLIKKIKEEPTSELENQAIKQKLVEFNSEDEDKSGYRSVIYNNESGVAMMKQKAKPSNLKYSRKPQIKGYEKNQPRIIKEDNEKVKEMHKKPSPDNELNKMAEFLKKLNSNSQMYVDSRFSEVQNNNHKNEAVKKTKNLNNSQNEDVGKILLDTKNKKPEVRKIVSEKNEANATFIVNLKDFLSEFEKVKLSNNTSAIAMLVDENNLAKITEKIGIEVNKALRKVFFDHSNFNITSLWEKVTEQNKLKEKKLRQDALLYNPFNSPFTLRSPQNNLFYNFKEEEGQKENKSALIKKTQDIKQVEKVKNSTEKENAIEKNSEQNKNQSTSFHKGYNVTYINSLVDEILKISEETTFIDKKPDTEAKISSPEPKFSLTNELEKEEEKFIIDLGDQIKSSKNKLKMLLFSNKASKSTIKDENSGTDETDKKITDILKDFAKSIIKK